jgi:hypothetical protein
MKTSDLIHALAEDHSQPAGLSFRQALPLFGVPAVAVTALILVLFLGVRSDLLPAFNDLNVLLKSLFTLALVAAALMIVRKMARPDAKPQKTAFLLLIPLLVLGFGVAREMAEVPYELWLTRLIGEYPLACLINIPLLALAPLAGLMGVMRQQAPSSSILAGAMSGLLAGAVAAAFYALHCSDDSPFFLAVWYVTAIMLVTVLGAIIGARVLRW